jgi:SAM-dependent methyltransferase
MSCPRLTRLWSRRARMFNGIDLAGDQGLEIGALTGPLVPKSGTHVLYVDHLDTAGLRAKYAGHSNVDPERIVPVDVVWSDAKLVDCLPSGTILDYVVASHVIEHVPDLVGWLAQIAAVLRPGGRLALVIPDKRFTFDYLREVSRLSDVVDAHVRGNRSPAPGQVFDYMAGTADVDVTTAWRGSLDPASLHRHQTPQQALEITRAAYTGAFVDVHVWVFTPTSALRLFAELVGLGLLRFACAGFDDTPLGELDMQMVLIRLPEDADTATAQASFLRALPEPPVPADPTAALRTEVAMLSEAVAALHASTSWRITAPLRALRRMF